MAKTSIDQYAPCLCGSGKQFKRCCAPYYSLVEQALDQQEAGQHEAALQLIAQLSTKFPTIAQVWCYRAQLEIMNGRAEEAEASLDRATDLNPELGLTYYLRGSMRQAEDEPQGALILLRRAFELYDPRSTEILASLAQTVAEFEIRFNRPVAARAAIERAAKLNPQNPQLRQILDTYFGSESRIPEPARRAYTFRKMQPSDAAAMQPAITSGKFSDAQKAFEKLLTERPTDPALLFNLGLTQAWQGSHPKAIDTLSRAIEHEADEALIAEAGALIEVLRFGIGMEQQADYLDYVVVFRVHNPQELVRFLQILESNDRLVGLNPDAESQSLSGLIVEESTGLLGGSSAAKLAANFLVMSNVLRLSNTNREALDKVAAEFSVRLPGVLQEEGRQAMMPNWGDVVTEALLFPTGQTTAAEMEVKIRDQARNFFEEIWIHRPLKSLLNTTPQQAVGSPMLRKKLLGVLKFLESCFDGVRPRIQEGDKVIHMSVYDFDRLRSKLGITSTGSSTVPTLDFATMSADNLAELDRTSLSSDQLGEGFRAALKLNAQDTASQFARQAISVENSGDLYIYYQHLLTQTQNSGDLARTLALLEEAKAADTKTNEGKRRDDYALKRAQLLAKANRPDEAATEFQALIDRTPSELRYIVTATETMISARQGARAQKFAEMGLVVARSKNQRDLEGYFQELLAAAKKQG